MVHPQHEPMVHGSAWNRSDFGCRRGNICLRAGDAMTIGKRIVPNQTAYSEGYIEIEVCIPADYDTIPDDAPEKPLEKVGWPD